MPNKKINEENLGDAPSTDTSGPILPTPPVATPDVSKLTDSINALMAVIAQEKADRNQQTQEILGMVQTQSEQMNELRAELDAVADKGRLADWDKKKADGKTKEKVINLQTYHGKVVVGWTPMKTNLVYKNQAGAIVEDQTTTLMYADNSQEDVKYNEWQAGRMPTECVLDSKEILSDETEILNLSDKAGNKYKVDARFVN